MGERVHTHSSLISETELYGWLQIKPGQRAQLERVLRQAGIPIIRGGGGTLCTTLEAINARGLGVASDTQVDDDDFADA